jgi:SAM-dependent methyltransferase
MSKQFYFLKSWVESQMFRLTRLAALPARRVYHRAQPDPAQWDYPALLASLEQYATTPKQTPEQVQQHQAKWAQRVIQLAELFGAQKVLEVGCGQGLLALRLQQYGLETYANDVIDILHPDVVQSGIPFEAGDVCEALPYPDSSFGIVFAVNAFEHFHDPAAALDEMLRVLKPGGHVYLTFDPLYYSPGGLHAARRLGIPYPQLLFAPETIQRLVDERRPEIVATYSEGSDTTRIGPPLNGYSIQQYRKLFSERRDRMKLLVYIERTDLSGIKLVRQHPGIFKCRAPSFDDLIVSGVKLLGVKLKAS